MRRLIRQGIVFTLLSCVALPLRADPLVMFLMSVARQMITDAIERDAARPKAPEPRAAVYGGTEVEPRQVRRLIDEGFGYLSERQRGEIFDSLHAELMKPKNALVRAPMIEYFAQRALAVRAARQRLAQLSTPEMERLAEEFRRRTLGMTGEERAQMAKVLNAGLLPVPADLNTMLLAALPEPAPVPATADAAPKSASATATGVPASAAAKPAVAAAAPAPGIPIVQ